MTKLYHLRGVKCIVVASLCHTCFSILLCESDDDHGINVFNKKISYKTNVKRNFSLHSFYKKQKQFKRSVF